MKKNWNNLNKEERAEYMWLQMSPKGNSHMDYLPEDCSECRSCGQPKLGTGGGFCEACYERWEILADKLEIK